jgi:hypothetical protein
MSFNFDICGGGNLLPGYDPGKPSAVHVLMLFLNGGRLKSGRRCLRSEMRVHPLPAGPIEHISSGEKLNGP